MALAIQESQTHGLVIADRVSLDAVLGFACLKKAIAREVVQSAFGALTRVWPVSTTA